MAIISGKNLIMNEQKINQCFVYKRVPSGETGVRDSFDLHKRLILYTREEFKQVSMQYYFVNSDSKGTQRDSILFAKIDQIFTLNFETDQVTTIYKF